MNLQEHMKAVSRQGAAMALYFYEYASATANTAEGLCAQFGLPRSRVGSIIRLGRDLHKDEASASAAAEGGLCVDVLIELNRAVLKFDAGDRAMMRLDLVCYAVEHECTPDEIKAVADHRVRERNGEPNPRRRCVHIALQPDAAGMRQFYAYLPDKEMAKVSALLHREAIELMKEDATLRRPQALAEAFLRRMGSRPGEPMNVAREGVILLPADGYTHEGKGWLATTDGARIHVDELLEGYLSDIGYVMVYDELCEPVDLRRVQRMANDKQRMMIEIDQLVCAHPDCKRLASQCQMHHVIPWKHGGETNISNLIAMCATHNARNDDDRQARNGYGLRHPITGRAAYQPADPEAPIRTSLIPMGQASGRAWANERRGRS